MGRRSPNVDRIKRSINRSAVTGLLILYSMFMTLDVADDYLAWLKVGGSELFFNPEDDDVLRVFSIVAQIIAETQVRHHP